MPSERCVVHHHKIQFTFRCPYLILLRYLYQKHCFPNDDPTRKHSENVLSSNVPGGIRRPWTRVLLLLLIFHLPTDNIISHHNCRGVIILPRAEEKVNIIRGVCISFKLLDYVCSPIYIVISGRDLHKRIKGPKIQFNVQILSLIRKVCFPQYYHCDYVTKESGLWIGITKW